MGDLIIKLACGEQCTQKDVEQALYELCDDVHATCDCRCPVFDLNGGRPAGYEKPFHQNRGCDCFKNGREMREFIIAHKSK